MFQPNRKGVLKFSRQYKKVLLESQDEDFIALANMEGQEIEFKSFPQPAISKEYLNVYINTPIEMSIGSKYIINQVDL